MNPRTTAQAALTLRQRLDIRRRRQAGERGVDLAKEYGVSPQLVANIHTAYRGNDELEALVERHDRIEEALREVRACMEWCVNLGADEQTAMSLRRGIAVADAVLRRERA